VHFSSASDDWATPQGFFDALDGEFSFTLDVCASASNAKCANYFTRITDGLSQDWRGERCWMNPPYGREIKAWMAKAAEASRRGALVVCLVPARTDTAWWHEYATHADEIRFVRGRLRFGAAKHAAPFPSAVVIFRPQCPDGNRLPVAVVVFRAKP
jgi:site-specific DNA-methyltransferase (adenine-specific)